MIAVHPRPLVGCGRRCPPPVHYSPRQNLTSAAYLAAQQPAAAAAEFQRIVDHRSIGLVDPMHAIARLQLARALALSGDAVSAKSAYNDLFTLWKNADPDIPVLKQARAEYARLP